MKILFVSRAFPPVVGGIENHNAALAQWLPKHAHVTTIANRGGKKMLFVFVPWLMLTLPFRVQAHDVVLLGDGVLAILAWWLKLVRPTTKIVCVLHGLDITYTAAIYQSLWVKRFLSRSDHFIAVGNHTIEQGVSHGLPRQKFSFVPNGVDPDQFGQLDESRTLFLNAIGAEHADKKVILTAGRLAKRKGVAWFIRTVLPQLPKDVIYVVAGDGPDRSSINDTIRTAGQDHRVVMLGRVSDELRTALYHECDVFVQPNINVHGDMEGFGLVVLEAAASGAVTVVSDLEGLRDAVHNGKNGFLVAHEILQAWTDKLTEVLADDFDRKTFGAHARDYTATHFSWNRVAKNYVSTLADVITD